MAAATGCCYALTMAKRFDGKVVWITGGGSGIGKALALQFAKEGGIVAVSGRREERLQEVVDAITAKGGKGLAVRCDVTDEASVAEAVQRVVRSLGGIDVAVANAGFSVAGRVEKLSAADWRRQLDVNVIGAAMTAIAGWTLTANADPLRLLLLVGITAVLSLLVAGPALRHARAGFADTT